jgi:hypothetical protein
VVLLASAASHNSTTRPVAASQYLPVINARGSGGASPEGRRRRPVGVIRVDRVRTGSASANEAGRRVGSTNSSWVQVGDRHPGAARRPV